MAKLLASAEVDCFDRSRLPSPRARPRFTDPSNHSVVREGYYAMKFTFVLAAEQLTVTADPLLPTASWFTNSMLVTVIVTGLVSMLLPLSRNLARSPIKDMRDDT